MSDDTIAAVATPLGAGGLGVVRVSGPGALVVGDKVFRGAKPLSEAPSHTLHHGTLRDGGTPLDDAVAALFRAPRSYTGEDVVEFSCHGSPALLSRVLAACLAAGARPAGPGEFTQRAYLNGKMDLAQAEAVAALIAARSDQARRWSLEQLQGSLSKRIDALRARILGLLAHLEAGLDFAEEEVPDLSRGALAQRLDALQKEVAALAGTAGRGRLFREGLRLVTAGRPNVGKSSLFNALLGAERAIVTELPGTTRDTLEESFDADGLPVVLTDTAGLREGAGRVEAEGIARARRAMEKADAVLWVMDAVEPFTPGDLDALRASGDRPALAVFNKTDLAGPSIDRISLERRAREARPGLLGAAFVSARTGDGLDDLKRLLPRAASAGPAEESGEGPTVLLDRHAALLKEAAAALSSAARAVGDGEECAAVDIRRALAAVDQVTGRGVPDEVLHEIFSRFCIGK